MFFLLCSVFSLNIALFAENETVNEKVQVIKAVHTFDKSIKEDALVYKMAALSSDKACLSPVVYLTGGSGYCGTGGCTLLIFDCEKIGYKLLGATSVALPPVYVAKSITGGYHDIKVHVKNKDLALLRFDGKHYASNASMAPSVKHHASDRLLMDEGFIFP